MPSRIIRTVATTSGRRSCCNADFTKVLIRRAADPTTSCAVTRVSGITARTASGMMLRRFIVAESPTRTNYGTNRRWPQEVSSSGGRPTGASLRRRGQHSATDKTLTWSVVHGTAREGEAPMGRGPANARARNATGTLGLFLIVLRRGQDIRRNSPRTGAYRLRTRRCSGLAGPEVPAVQAIGAEVVKNKRVSSHELNRPHRTGIPGKAAEKVQRR